MKKIILVLFLASALLLTGCGNDKVDESQDLKDNTQIENVEQLSGENEILKEEENTETANAAIISALKDSEWVKENVSMKKTCFGEEFTGSQKLTFEMLKDDLAIVQAYAYDSNEGNAYDFGVQVFLVGYSDGEVKVKALPEEGPAHPGHGGYEVNVEDMVLVNNWMHQGSMKATAYKISNLMFEEIESFSYNDTSYDHKDPITDEVSEEYYKEYDEATQKIIEFNQKYEAHPIEKLIEGNL